MVTCERADDVIIRLFFTNFLEIRVLFSQALKLCTTLLPSAMAALLRHSIIRSLPFCPALQRTFAPAVRALKPFPAFATSAFANPAARLGIARAFGSSSGRFMPHGVDEELMHKLAEEITYERAAQENDTPEFVRNFLENSSFKVFFGSLFSPSIVACPNLIISFYPDRGQAWSRRSETDPQLWERKVSLTVAFVFREYRAGLKLVELTRFHR